MRQPRWAAVGNTKGDQGTLRGTITSRHTGHGALLGVSLFKELDGASGGDEEGGTGALLVGELALGEHLDMAKLGHRDVTFSKDGLGVVEGDAGLTGDAISNALLKFLASVDIHLGHTIVLKNGNYYIRSANCNIYANAADVYIIQSTVNTYYHTFGNVVFGPSNTIQSYHFEMCSIVPNNGDDLENISANAGLSNIYGTICLELKPGNITVTGSGWEDDVIGLPTPNTHRMAYLFYNGADGLLGTIWKRQDGKIKSSAAFTLVASNTLYLSGIATA